MVFGLVYDDYDCWNLTDSQVSAAIVAKRTSERACTRTGFSTRSLCIICTTVLWYFIILCTYCGVIVFIARHEPTATGGDISAGKSAVKFWVRPFVYLYFVRDPYRSVIFFRTHSKLCTCVFVVFRTYVGCKGLSKKKNGRRARHRLTFGK